MVKDMNSDDESNEIAKRTRLKDLQPIIKDGYSDGALEGSNSSFQKGFDKGYEEGIKRGYLKAYEMTLIRLQSNSKLPEDYRDFTECETCFKGG